MTWNCTIKCDIFEWVLSILDALYTPPDGVIKILASSKFKSKNWHLKVTTKNCHANTISDNKKRPVTFYTHKKKSWIYLVKLSGYLESGWNIKYIWVSYTKSCIWWNRPCDMYLVSADTSNSLKLGDIIWHYKC